MILTKFTQSECKIFHDWNKVYDTGFTVYEECSHCKSRRAIQPNSGGYQPVDFHWLEKCLNTNTL